MVSSPSSTSTSTSGSSSEMSNSQIVRGEYIQENTSKRDLVRRLRKLLLVLQDDEDIEPASPDYPGLLSLCDSLVPLVDHRDKQVRLYTVAACMELFAIHVSAPTPPWTTPVILDIFRQTIRQLANLAHTSPQHAHFEDYFRILDLLAQVKIGAVLVELRDSADALPVLSDLFRTLLQSIRLEHPPEIADLIQTTICGCLEEYFYDGIMLPVPLLDELLLCIGQGPIVLVVNPHKAAQRRHKLPAHQVEQTNPSYLVASTVIRKVTDGLSTPIAALLNGLLNNDRLVSESSISTQPLRELAKPQTQNQLSQADVWNIIYELHRIAPTILTTVVGTLAGFLSVPELEQRRRVVQLLGKIFQSSLQFGPCFRQWLERAQDSKPEIRLLMVDLLLPLASKEEAAEPVQAMLQLCLDDPSPDVRLKTIHGLCDVAYKHHDALSLEVWLSVGMRVASKHKQERKDALTGLAQTYFKHYTEKRLVPIQAGGDDCPLEDVQRCLQASEDERFHWIPSRVFECASYKGDLQIRVYQVMDDLLLGSQLPNSSKTMTDTARAVAMALLMDSLEPNALSWLGELLQKRSKLQHALQQYLQARLAISEHPHGSEEALTAHAKAQDLLERVAFFTDMTTPAGERHPILEQLHSVRDKQVFRLLATIATPTHSVQERVKALEEIPKRVKRLGEATLTWVRGLIRRCAMGDFLNSEVVHHCILLAQESGIQEDWESCRKFLQCVQAASDPFPSLCASEESFQTLLEILTDCNDNEIITMLVSILAKAAPRAQESGFELDSQVQKDLLRLCREGKPEQARHAVRTLMAMIGPQDTNQKAFALLLNSLSTSSTEPNRFVCSMVALAELAEYSPPSMAKGQKAVQVALDQLSGPMEASPKRRKSKQPSDTILQDESLAGSCRKLCGAIEFLVSYVRSSILYSGTDTPSHHIIEQLFEALSQILKNQGVPPSGEGNRQERAALRQCSAVHLLRLCDARLGLDERFLTPDRWHILSASFLDEEAMVRDVVMEELGLMLTGNGKYSGMGGKAMTPSFRFLACVVLCIDSDHAANANAANLGKRSTSTKSNASVCISSLRRTYEIATAQARADGSAAEERFESRMKVRLMPEYSVPYAIHLLALRPETPESADDIPQRVLRKRLKWLLDPLVLSLGDSADNISFLIRMTELITKFRPVGVESKDPVARLQMVCSTARQVLLSYVKTDVNLASYPGAIQLPGRLYRRMSQKPKVPTKDAPTTPARSSRVREPLVDKTDSSSQDREGDASVPQSEGRPSDLPSRVHFSPAIGNIDSNMSKLSPIDRKLSLGESPNILLSSGEKTRGTTPPSIVKNTRFTASLPTTGATVSDSQSLEGTSKGTSRQDSKSSSRQASTASGRSKRSASSEEDKIAKKPKKSIPSQIKILRNRPSRASRSTKNSGGDLDFGTEKSVKKRRSHDKENQQQPRRSSRNVR